jgi:two-component sensor histidine kinase
MRTGGQLCGRRRKGEGTLRSAELWSRFAAVLILMGVVGGGAQIASASDHDPPILTRIKAIRDLAPEEAALGRRVRIRGTITHLKEPAPAGIIIHDGEAGQFVLYDANHLSAHPEIDLRRGDLVEVQGVTIQGGFAPDVVPQRITKLGRSSFPEPKHPSYAALMTGRYDCDYVEITGIGQRTWKAEPPSTVLFLEVAVEGGTVRAWFWGHSPADRDRFIDARVRLRGSVGALVSRTRQAWGVSLMAGRASEVVVEEPPTDPFSLPLRPIASLYTFSAKGELDRRVRVKGTVTYHRPGRTALVDDIAMHARFRETRHLLYLRDGTGTARVETDQDLLVQPGDVVDLVGFPALATVKPALRYAIFKTAGMAPVPAPLALSAEKFVAEDHDGQLVRVNAELLGQVTTPAGPTLILRAGESVFEATLNAGFPREVGQIRAGSLVSTTGIYTYQPGPPPAIRLLLRSPGDVALLKAAPWWTPRHTLVVMIVVALIGSAALVWIRMIVNRNALVRERYQVVLTERGRLARELHDTFEQGLAGIRLQLGAVARSLDTSPETARRSLEVASEMLRYSLSEARRSVMDLRAHALESTDLATAIADLARQMTDRTALTATVRVVGTPRTLDAAHEHHLFRISLEALTNTIKHADATRIEIELRFEEHATVLIVVDNGRGLPGTDISPRHFGLKGIRERVDKLGGTLLLGSSTGGGTRLAVTVPIDVAVTHDARREALHA